MGHFFHTKTSSEHGATTYFFSFEDMQEASGASLPTQSSPVHLSLGRNFSDWHNGTYHLVEKLYADLSRDAPKIWGDRLPTQIFSEREAKILVGNLSLYIAQRLARSIAQLDQTPTGSLLDSDKSELPTRLRIPESLDTGMSIQTIKSREFDQLVDLLAMNHVFSFARATSVHVTPRKLSESRKLSFPEKIYVKVAGWTSKFSHRNKFSISASYLGRFTEQLLLVSLSQWPSLTELREAQSPSSRNVFDKVIYIPGDSSLRELAFFLLQCVVPVTLVENFQDTLSAAHQSGFSKEPSVVLTANSFEADDHFKAHLVNALPRARYLVAQHGVGYGVSKTRSLCPEKEASDLFLSWGWGHSTPGVYPFGVIKSEIKKRQEKISGVTLFLRPERFMYHLCADMGQPNDEYFSSVLDLCRELNEFNVPTTLRVHHTTSTRIRDWLSRETQELRHASMDTSGKSMSSLISSGEGIVFTYDSTGMLELATSGITFFSYMTEGLALIDPLFAKNYEALAEVGLLSENPSDAAKKIAEWQTASPDLRQEQFRGLEAFCAGLALKPKNRISSLRALLRRLSLQSPCEPAST